MAITHTVINERTGERDSRPEEYAGGHDDLAIVTVAEVTEERREKHVADDECRRKKRRQREVNVVKLLDLRENTWENKLLSR